MQHTHYGGQMKFCKKIGKRSDTDRVDQLRFQQTDSLPVCLCPLVDFIVFVVHFYVSLGKDLSYKPIFIV